MINIKTKEDCCGCNACGDICPKKAITFKTDIEGFWYPEIDKELCIDCGLCDKICPIINIGSLKQNEFETSECHAAIHNNLEVRFDSTSGGLFSAFAEEVYRQGGYVGGAIFNDDFSVKHFISNDRSDLINLRSSKYLQSDASGFYKLVASLLKENELVLVCGTPCQMVALRAYLRQDYENLIILDFICLGVNSPKVFRKYLDYLERRFDSKVVHFKAKNKELGWRNLTSKIVFENGRSFYDTKDTSFFTKGYLRTHVYTRPSCYECKFKGLPRISDITIADFWGVEKIGRKDLDNDLGTSLVMVNNSKGQKFWNNIAKKISTQKIPFDSILKGNPALLKSMALPLIDRDAFYKRLDKENFEDIARELEYSNSSFKKQIKSFLKKYYFIVKNSRLHISPLYNVLKFNSLSSLFCSHGLLIPTPYCVINIHKSSNCHYGGLVQLGRKKFPSSHLETRLLVDKDATFIVNDDYIIGYGADIEVFSGAKLEIRGKGATNIGTTIICAESIYIGEHVMIGRHVTIRDNNGGHYMSRRGYKDTRPVIIEDKAWLCEGCTIMPGAKIGEGAIVGAKAVVFNNVPPHAVVSGNPAVVVDEDVYWKY